MLRIEEDSKLSTIATTETVDDSAKLNRIIEPLNRLFADEVDEMIELYEKHKGVLLRN